MQYFQQQSSLAFNWQFASNSTHNSNASNVYLDLATNELSFTVTLAFKQRSFKCDTFQ